ncbi:transmembrane protein 170A [Thamnophis elegans]|uniref:transmembrane protein 170A n=1 Tax=Thamnophis elegans TaxID=35005 RepID=UPI001376DD24|nr:transmembrane protein 170A [Thamnophis elegans]
MAEGGGASPSDSGGLWQQILSLRLIPRVGNATSPDCVAALCHFTEMWYGIFLWALVSSLFFHIPAGLLALFTLRRHRYGRFMPVSIFLMGLVGPLAAGTLTSAAIAGVFRAAGKKMIPFVALTWGVGQTFCIVMISFLRILATL